mmetsp:Transcript_4152/g.13001  ORF Transcript_4152/g.13001 Transcript_4152/m.13001 type:complete len:134 (+) Transcript_4152:768-1169(+)
MLLHTCVPNSQTRYGRTFHINGCNESTRAFLHNTRGVEPSSDSLPPVDRYEMERCVLRVHDRDMMRGNVLRFRRDLMSRETGKDPSVSHNIQKNPMKVLPSSPSIPVASLLFCRFLPKLLLVTQSTIQAATGF